MQHTHQFVPNDGEVCENSYAVPQLLLSIEKVEEFFASFEKKPEESKNNNNNNT